MTLDIKKFFDTKLILFTFAIVIRIFVLVIDGLDKYILGDRCFELSYLSKQIMAIGLDATVAVLLYLICRQILARSAPSLFCAALYIFWPFMDQVILVSHPLEIPVIMVSALYTVYISNVLLFSRVSIYQWVLLSMALFLIIEPLGFGLIAGIISLLIFAFKLPKDCRLTIWQLNTVLLIGLCFAVFTFKPSSIIIAPNSIFLIVVLLFLQIKLIIKKGIGRTASLSSVLLGGLLAFVICPHKLSTAFLVFSLPSIVSFFGYYMERWVVLRQLKNPKDKSLSGENLVRQQGFEPWT